jgi:hypothetical protein
VGSGGSGTGQAILLVLVIFAAAAVLGFGLAPPWWRGQLLRRVRHLGR